MMHPISIPPTEKDLEQIRKARIKWINSESYWTRYQQRRNADRRRALEIDVRTWGMEDVLAEADKQTKAPEGS